MPAKKKRRAAQDVLRVFSPLPKFFTPMMAQRADELPEGALNGLTSSNWMVIVRSCSKIATKCGCVRAMTSNLTTMYPSVAADGARLNAIQAIVDGEIVAVDQLGRPSFQALQHRGSHPRHAIVFYAFDLPYVDDVDLMNAPIEKRRSKLLEIAEGSRVPVSQTLPGAAAEVARAVQAADRTNDWVKLKLEHNEEFVIGGYRPADHSVDAILVGYYAGSKLRFAGKVRAGFVPNVRRKLFETLTSHHSNTCPFTDLPNGSSRWGGGVTANEMKDVRWLTSRLVAQIRFTEWTHQGRLRHAKFLGLRLDKDSKAIGRAEG